MQQRYESCDQHVIFEDLLNLLEDPLENKKILVRRFFNNTFGTTLNDALFAL